MTLPTRLVVFQRSSQPLEVVTTRLEGWGCQLHDCETPEEALSWLSAGRSDVVLVDAGIDDGMAIVAQIKANQATRCLPVVAASADDEASVAAHALALGADDFFSLPIEDTELYARIRALARLALMEVELRERELVMRQFGVATSPNLPNLVAGERIRILLIGPAGGDQVQVMTALGGATTAAYAETADSALERLQRGDIDVVVITACRDHREPQRLCAAIRADDNLFDLPVLLIGQPQGLADRSVPFQWGVSDVLFQPFHPEILRLRVRGWVRQQRLRRKLRAGLDASARSSVIDPLTQLYTHGFLHAYVEHLIDRNRLANVPLAVASFSVTNMHVINQMYGYAAGDRVLAQIGTIIARSSRAEDLPARFGDDRFAVVINGASGPEAEPAVERIATILTQSPLVIESGEVIQVALRIGIAEIDRDDDAMSLIGCAFDRMQPFGLRVAS